MTVPIQHNCSHQGEGWCLECVGKLQAELDKWPRVFFKSMDPRSATEGFRVLSIAGKEVDSDDSYLNVTIEIDGQEIFAPSDFGLYFSKDDLEKYD